MEERSEEKTTQRGPHLLRSIVRQTNVYEYNPYQRSYSEQKKFCGEISDMNRGICWEEKVSGKG